jgi:hypothetical protein
VHCGCDMVGLVPASAEARLELFTKTSSFPCCLIQLPFNFTVVMDAFSPYVTFLISAGGCFAQARFSGLVVWCWEQRRKQHCRCLCVTTELT